MRTISFLIILHGYTSGDEEYIMSMVLIYCVIYLYRRLYSMLCVYTNFLVFIHQELWFFFYLKRGERYFIYFFFKSALKKLYLWRSFELNSHWEMNVQSFPCNRQTLLINGKASLMFALLIHQNGMKGRSIKREVRRNLCWNDPYLDVYCMYHCTYLYIYNEWYISMRV